ncbi:MAG: hypothetical protein H7Y20_05455 [Bryobacteraceae bacterium]|nr:hypothetical protein [Bryobacteraceae bacterium]
MLTSENATIAVCATACGEGASWAASMMACATAEDGDSVVLVDGDICKPRQKQAFEITSDRPLPLPWGGQRLFELNRTSSQQILVFSPTHLQAQTEREAGASLRGDLPGLRSQWGNVIVDCPPIPESTLLLEIASVVDGVVLVVKAEQERRDELKEKVDWLKRMGPPVLGVIFNKGKGYLSRFLEKAL